MNWLEACLEVYCGRRSSNLVYLPISPYYQTPSQSLVLLLSGIILGTRPMADFWVQHIPSSRKDWRLKIFGACKLSKQLTYIASNRSKLMSRSWTHIQARLLDFLCGNLWKT